MKIGKYLEGKIVSVTMPNDDIEKGKSLIEIIADNFKSAKTTAKWEMELSDIAQGKSSKKEFLEEIESEIKEAVLIYRK